MSRIAGNVGLGRDRRARMVLVVNPRSLASIGDGQWRRVRGALALESERCEILETLGDGGDGDRVAELMADMRPDVLISAGGDGTMNEAVQALMAMPEAVRPVLGMLPFGTANNVARSLGLRSCRRRDVGAVDLAVKALLRGEKRRIDLGQVGDRYFIGAAALGMDADILALRNRMARLLRPPSVYGGYALYLLSCAINLGRPHGVRGRLHIDGADLTAKVYNLLLLNTAIYAGEFRFAGGEASGDGRLDFHLFPGAVPYVRGFVSAWRRHLRHQRGVAVEAPPAARPIAAVRVELERALACQLDGEEYTRSDRYEFRVVPQALVVRVPTCRL